MRDDWGWGEREKGRGGGGGGGGGGGEEGKDGRRGGLVFGVVIMSTSTSTQIPNQKTRLEKKSTSTVNNTVNKLILDMGSFETLHKK